MRSGILMIGGVATAAVAITAAVVISNKPEQIETLPVPISAAVEAPVSAESRPDPVQEVEVAGGTTAAAAPALTNMRVESDGFAMISGTAQPGEEVIVTVNQQPVDTVTADSTGRFVVLPNLGYSDAPRVLDIIADPEGAARSADQSFVIASNPAPVEDATQDTAEVVTSEEIADIPETAIEVAEDTPASSSAEDVTPAPAIIALDGADVQVVPNTANADIAPEVMSTVSLDTITYNQSGDVILAGRAPNTQWVHLYVDNASVARLPVDAAGAWRTDLPDVDTGVYTLRIDEVAASGEVVSRIETPFRREEPSVIAASMGADTSDPNFSVATKTVQPGHTLWAIARERYGQGIMYLSVFEANKDRIRNPHLIYPGQVVMLPAASN